MSEKASLDSADIMRVLELLPHRYPFLMIDRIIEMDGDDSCIGIKNVTFNEPHFIGHFPQQPVMPGVLIIEAMAQTAGALCVNNRSELGQPKVVYFMTIDRAKFRKPVVPGDVVHIHVQKVKNRANIWKFACEAKVDGTKVAEAEVSAMLIGEDQN
ncbi:3-hydroxyacyl-ACP dehydratase FabZ [Cohaesibacter gelatinilyticus]|uniref:3-hydroxyacyl-[acyl-carrier-protein] dehydratase FabZ n=1 Tax=Cohaesibacter gelatinilyticus TaxID=372072 RepID=A0A285NEC1_9HYPH|nr:3-hydroxyacyl-ACP dehydratase FabZ [Cohaesibacter gelatinilyticus]SNZ07854.1 3-hydroxyacyl-[acyl-carrier-protein] dehydratase [Cohaesibacter gelatinilyticus]HAT87633.1 3-hydroxyacyl-[acyl-carrier-protein] dehydratase FabZ [Hyphomicrobiales bacterium]